MHTNASLRNVSDLERAEEDFLAMFPRSMIVAEPAYRNWLNIAIKKWPLDMQERISNMRSLVNQTELSNVDARVKAIARYCWKRLREEYPDHIAQDGIFR